MKKFSHIWVLFLVTTVFGQTSNAPSTGDGSLGNPYQIATWQNLYWISQNTSSWNKYYIQTANIDLNSASPAINTWDSNKGWTPIGNTSTNFTGSYNGQGYTIEGLYIDRSSTDHNGLFGYINGATISNVELVDGSVKGGANTGGLIGSVYGSSTVSKSYNTGTVQGSSCIGGLVGTNYNGTITFCYNTGTIGNGVVTTSGSSYVGGLVGHNQLGLIQNCYSTGTINGGYWGVGGLVGYNNTDGGTVDKSYSTGQVIAYPNPDPSWGLYRYGGLVGDCCSGPVNNSYWDTQTSGTSLSPSGQGTGKTTEQMKTQSTFSTWDFTTVWQIIGGDGSNYPSLRDNPDPALPVDLISFDVIFNNYQSSLFWSTATEVNNYGFEIERKSFYTIESSLVHSSSEGWIRIGFVQGYGNSNSPKSYSFVDLKPSSGKMQYRLKQIDYDGVFKYSEIIEVTATIPTQFNLEQNYPNPFNPETTIRYSIPNVGKGLSLSVLKVYDVLGREVATLVNEPQPAGNYEVKFNASHAEHGRNMVSGVYFYNIRAGKYSETKKFVLMK